jgi:hypothetical protein
MRRTKIFLVLITIVTAPSARAQTSAPFDGAAWRQDLEVIAAELPARHPDLFCRMSRASWDSAVGAIDQRLPAMTRNEAMVAFMELVALPNDGHTSLTPIFDPAFDVRYYPVEFHSFDDGLYVRSAAPEHASLAGAKVLRIGRATADEALAAVARTIPHENEWWARAWAPGRLAIPEVLDGLGLVEDMERLPIVVERGGRRDTVFVRPAGRLQPRGHDPAGPIDRSGWADMRGPGEPPLWLRNAGRPYWAEFVPADGSLYVAYRGVVDAKPGNVEFWRHVFAMADSLPVERMVIDIRENSGGDSFFNRQVVRGIVARPALDDPDRLFVVLGRRTFSAAMNLALDLESWTNATFVGEPTGNATMFFGDHEQIVLPASGLTVNMSTLPWHPDDPRDHRPFLAPDIYTPLTAADYRAGVDPAMRAILARAAGSSLAERVEAAVLEGDSAAAVRLVEEASRDVANRFRPPEADVNALGYRLLRAGSVAEAIEVFRINTGVFPMSANVWDSLGEGLLAAGRRDEAIAAYRRALEIDPEFASAAQALERLGAH